MKYLKEFNGYEDKCELISDLFLEYADKWRLKEIPPPDPDENDDDDDYYAEEGRCRYYIYRHHLNTYYIAFKFTDGSLFLSEPAETQIGKKVASSGFILDMEKFCHRLRLHGFEVELKKYLYTEDGRRVLLGPLIAAN